MNALLRYCRWMAGFCLLGLSLTTAAQVKTADIEQLKKDMYRLFNKPDSLQQYIQVTNQLKEASKQANNEELFYKAWANQAIAFSVNDKRQQAQNIIKDMSEYASKNDSKYGLFTSTLTNAYLASALRMEKQAEELYLQCINYKEQYLPHLNIALVYLGLSKIYHNRSQKDKALEMADKVLHEPDLLPEHLIQALNFKCMAALIGEENKEEFNRYYAELDKARKKTGISMGLSQRLDVYYAEFNGDYEKELVMAQNLKNKAERMIMTARAYGKL